MKKSHLYTLYIDETGSRYPTHASVKRDDGMDHFGWGGILVNQDDEEVVVSAMKIFRAKWQIKYHLHSSEIRGVRDNFSWLSKDQNIRNDFLNDLGDLLANMPVLGFGVVVSRPDYNKRYKEEYGSGRWELCKSAHPILIERVVRYLIKEDPAARLRIIFEGASGAENDLIVEYTRHIKRHGHPFSQDAANQYTPLPSRVYDRVIIGDAQVHSKANFFLQIADLYIYPISKRAYDRAYFPWVCLYESQRIIDALLPPDRRKLEGIKYYCFEDI